MLPRNHGKSQHYEIMRAAIKGYEMALDEVFKAYPNDLFPDTTQAERDPVIEKYPGFIDRTSAMMGRHIAKVIREKAMYFARDILEESSGGRTMRAADVLPCGHPSEFAEYGEQSIICVLCGESATRRKR